MDQNVHALRARQRDRMPFDGAFRFWPVLLVIVTAGCLDPASPRQTDASAQEDDHEVSDGTTETRAPGPPRDPSPERPKPKPTTIDDAGEVALGAVHTGWNWQVEPGARRIFVAVSFPGLAGAPRALGGIDAVLTGPAYADEAGNDPAQPEIEDADESDLFLELKDPEPATVGAWELRIDTQDPGDVGSYTGGWTATIRVEY